MMNLVSLIIVLLTLFLPNQPYIELATTYSSGKIVEFKEYVRTNGEKFDNVSTEHPPFFFSTRLDNCCKAFYAYENNFDFIVGQKPRSG